MKILPAREDFHAHAAEHTIVPVWTSVLADLETPVAAYVKLVGDGPGFLLESVEGAERWARFSFVGRNPTATIVSRNGVVELDGTLPDGIPTGEGILAALEALLAIHSSPDVRRSPAAARRGHGVPRLRRDPRGRAPARRARRRSGLSRTR